MDIQRLLKKRQLNVQEQVDSVPASYLTNMYWLKLLM